MMTILIFLAAFGFCFIMVSLYEINEKLDNLRYRIKNMEEKEMKKDAVERRFRKDVT